MKKTMTYTDFEHDMEFTYGVYGSAAESEETNYESDSNFDADDYIVVDSGSLNEIYRMMSEGGVTGFSDDEEDDYEIEHNGYGKGKPWGYDPAMDWDYDDETEAPSKENSAKWKKEAEDKKNCEHVFIKTQGLSRFYEDCKHCGIKKEDIDGNKK